MALNFDDFNQPIVIDNGTGSVKAGFASEDIPIAIFPAVVGHPDKLRQRGVLVGLSSRDDFVGDEAQRMRGLLTLNYPMRHGIVTNWNDMEKIWHHTFWKELGANPEDHPLLMTEAPQNPTNHRVTMFQTMFESFNVPAMYVSIQAVLSLYASGRTTGVVIDSGDGVTHVVPIFEGYAIPSAVKRLDLAGRDLTEYLITLLMESCGLSLQSSAGFEIAKDIKEKLCFVHQDYDTARREIDDADLAGCKTILAEVNRTYTEMPDGSEVIIGPERYMCPEALFKPALIGMDAPGIHQMLNDSVQKCQFDIRRLLYQNIVLSGGTAMLQGLEQRLDSEVRQLIPSAMQPKLYAPRERKYSVWIGGSILASLSSFNDKWITKKQFSELGPYGLKRLCF